MLEILDFYLKIFFYHPPSIWQPIRAPAVPPAGTAHHLSFPLVADIVMPAPSKPPIMLPSLQLLSSITFGAGAVGLETLGDGL